MIFNQKSNKGLERRISDSVVKTIRNFQRSIVIVFSLIIALEWKLYQLIANNNLKFYWINKKLLNF
jgi:hypothetical protein